MFVGKIPFFSSTVYLDPPEMAPVSELSEIFAVDLNVGASVEKNLITFFLQV